MKRIWNSQTRCIGIGLGFIFLAVFGIAFFSFPVPAFLVIMLTGLVLLIRTIWFPAKKEEG